MSYENSRKRTMLSWISPRVADISREWDERACPYSKGLALPYDDRAVQCRCMRAAQVNKRLGPRPTTARVDENPNSPCGTVRERVVSACPCKKSPIARRLRGARLRARVVRARGTVPCLYRVYVRCRGRASQKITKAGAMTVCRGFWGTETELADWLAGTLLAR